MREARSYIDLLVEEVRHLPLDSIAIILVILYASFSLVFNISYLIHSNVFYLSVFERVELDQVETWHWIADTVLWVLVLWFAWKLY